MNVAVILAGGVGKRMGADVPKQFIEIMDKPIIVYTLEKFENNEEIDAIQVVAVESYIQTVWDYVEKYNISKVKWVVAGGKTAQESTRNSVFHLENHLDATDTVMFHMSVSPLIDDEIISDSLDVSKQHGNAIAGAQSIFNICELKDNYYSDEYYSKKNLVTLNMPWTINYGRAIEIYKKAYSENIATGPEDYLVSLLIELGDKLYFSKDTQKNKLKLTTFDDLDMFEGYLLVQNKKNNCSGGC